MAVDFELPSRDPATAGGNGGVHDVNQQPPRTQGEASSSPLPQKPPESYIPYASPLPPPGWGPQQSPQQVDFRTIPSIPPDIRSRTLFGLHEGEPRPPLLLAAAIFRAVLLIASMAFMAMVIVLAIYFKMLYSGWIAAGSASLLADLTAISLPLLAYERRGVVSIAHAVLDAAAIALFAVSSVAGLFLVTFTSQYPSRPDPWWDRTSNNLVNSCRVFTLLLM
ncbi:hypothetical protein Sste5346_005940 [Sporothrix stenoceras]|uniref:MARVEL domain-containing protein n=1 Tax=Sporothrix stenoceras TaxID=5173 RepID=A0ABR3Z3S8_9PEZI